MKVWVSRVITLSIFIAFFFLVGFLKNYHLPRLKTWMLIEVEKYSAKELPVRIWPEDVEISFLPVKVKFLNVRVFPKDNLKSSLSDFSISNVEISLNLFALFYGHLRIQKIAINESSITGIFNEQNLFSKNKDSKNKLKNINFSILRKIPVDTIQLNNIDLILKSTKQNHAAKIDGLNFEVNNLENKIRIHISSDRVHLKKINTKPILSFTISTNFILDPKSIVITALKLKKQNSYLVGTSLIKGNILKGNFNNIEAKVRSEVLLSEVSQISKEFFPDLKFPSLEGSLQSELDLNYNFSDQIRLDYVVKSQSALIEGYELGNATFTGKVNNKDLYLSRADFRHSSGRVKVTDLNLHLGETKTIRANIEAQKLEIGKLLNSIKIPDVPLKTYLDADLPCYGELSPKFKLTCMGTVFVNDVNVWSDNKRDFNIVKLSPAEAIGKFEIDQNKVEYDTKLQINNSSGWSKGTIDYVKGFNIFYGGNIKAFEKDVQNLANLKLEGSAIIDGRTWGTSSWGRIRLNLKGKNVWLEDFGLGSPSFDLGYKKGVLNFRDINAQQASTRIKGKLSLNLNSSLIKMDLASPFLDSQDLTYLLSRKVQLPIKIRGTGSAKFNAKGPLKFKYLSYQLQSSLYRGNIAEESFDQLNFDVTSNNGFVETNNVVLSKADSRVQFKGKVNPQGDLDSVLLGERLRLEQSEFLNNIGFNLGGQLDFTMAMRGPILSPNTELHGRLSKTIIAEIPEPDSSFWLKFNNSSLEGRGKFIGNVVQTEFKIPYTKEENFKLYLKSNKWNFANLFNMLSGSEIQKDYKTELSSEIRLESPNDWMWNSTGFIKLHKLILDKGDYFLENNLPMEILLKKGVLEAKNFRLDGPSSFLELRSKESSRKNLDLSLNGKFNLSLASLFTPFLDEIRGITSVSLNLNGPAENPDMLGSAYVQDGLIKLKGLRHSFEELTTDILLNQNTLLINALKSDFAGGNLTANGQIKFNALENIPINIKGQFKDVELNIPDGFITRGYGDIQILGAKPPYVLSANYEVNDGDIKINLAGNANSKERIQPSDFLPKFLSEQSLDPLHLDLKINIPRPIPVDAQVPEAKVTAKIQGKIRVMNSPLRPILTGAFQAVPGGRMVFRSNNFDLNSATVEYNNRPPTEPDLLVTATSNIRTKSSSDDLEITGEEYEVTLDVQGNAKNLALNLSSQPILSESDIVSLLAFGITSTQYQKLDSDQQAIQSGVEVGAQFLKQQLEINKAFESTTGFDLTISPVLDDENAAPKFSASKQFTPKFGMSISHTEGKAPTNEMKFEYKFNPRLSIVGEIERQEAGGSEDGDNAAKNQEKVGLDLEYKFQYK